MHSSIRRCASFLCTRTMRSILPLASKIICVSTDSKSIAPRFCRAPKSALKTRYRVSISGAAVFLALEHRRDFRVRHALVGMDHARIELVALHHAARGHLHLAHHHEAIDLGLERAQLVGELLGQHRDHAPREVHRVAAVVRLAVERIARAHVVAHVGDRDPQAKLPPREALLSPLGGRGLRVHRIVEILRRFTIDRHERQLAQVLASLDVLRVHHLRQPPRRLLRIARPLVRQVVLAQRDLDLHPGIGVVAEDLDHAPDGLGVLGGLRDELGDDNLALLRALEAIGRDEDVLADALVLGDEEGDAVLDEEAPDDLLVGALEHFHDGTFEPAAAIHAGHAREHHVAVQRLVHLLRPEEEIVLAVLGTQEPEAVGMPDHLALDEARLVGDEDRAAAVAHDLAVALHGGHAPLEALALLGARDLQQLGELVFGDRDTLFGESFEDALAARNLGRKRLQAIGFDGHSSVHRVKFLVFRAQMAELVDAPVSGTGG